MDISSGFYDVSHFFKDNKDFLTIMAGALGGGLALKRYWSDQTWRKRQFAYDYAQKVFDDPKSMMALRMLDWSNGEVPAELAKEYSLPETERSWNLGEVATALRLHDRNSEGTNGGEFSKKEYLIREIFDACLAHFDRLGNFVSSRILSISDFPTTLGYYVRILDEARLAPVRKPLLDYMARYGFDDAHRLFERLLEQG